MQGIRLVAAMADCRADVAAVKELSSNPLALAAKLSDQKIAQIIGIVLDVKEESDLDRFREITLEELSGLVLALTETNDFAAIFANLGAVTEKIQAFGNRLNPALKE
jgi:hypothetical protein